MEWENANFLPSEKNRILIQMYITFYDWYMLSRTIERNFHAFITLENILRRGWGQNLFMKAERIKSKQCVSPSSPSSSSSAFYSLYVSERQAFATLITFDKKKLFRRFSKSSSQNKKFIQSWFSFLVNIVNVQKHWKRKKLSATETSPTSAQLNFKWPWCSF